MIAQTKKLVTQHWKKALAWLLLPTVLVAAFYAYKHFKKPPKDSNTEGSIASADTIESRIDTLNKCGKSLKDGESISNCSDLLQQVMGEARSLGKDIILLDDKYVIA